MKPGLNVVAKPNRVIMLVWWGWCSSPLMWSRERKLEKVELAVILSEPHSPELETHTDKQSVIRVGKLSVGWGSVPAWKKEREDRIWILLPVSVDLLHHGRRSRGRGRNPVLTNSELYLTTPYLWLLCITIRYSMCMIVHVIHSILYALEFRFWMNVNHEKSLFDVCGNPEHYTFYIVKVDPILTAFSCSFNGCFWMNVEWHDQVCGFAAIVVYLYMVLPLLSIYTWCSQCRGWIVTVWNGTLHSGLCTEGNILNIPARVKICEFRM